jgi:iron complex transport system ATP-binding protein
MIEINALSCSSGGTPVLRGVSLSAGEGEIIGIIGPSGSGKTAFLRAVAGLVSGSRGSVTVDGRDVFAMKARERNRAVCLFAGDRPLNPDTTVEGFVHLSRSALRGAFSPLTDVDRDIADASIGDLGLDRHRNKRLGDLSTGLLTLTTLAHAMSRESRVLLLDDPTRFLDLSSLLMVHRALAKISSRGRGCIIVASHDINFVSQCADRILVFSEGSVVEEGSPAIITAEMIEKHFGAKIILTKNVFNGRPVVHCFPEN